MGVKMSSLPPAGEEYGVALDNGCLSTPSRMSTGSLSLASGLNWVSVFRAPKTFLCSKVTIATSSTAAGATPTLVRFGIYTFDPVAGTGTLVASTPNDTTLLSTTDTLFEKALSAAYQINRGTWYAASILVVTGAAAPTIIASLGVTGARRLNYQKPIQSQLTSGNADLPASLTDNLLAGNFAPIIGLKV